MRFKQPLYAATVLKRYKRFLCDVQPEHSTAKTIKNLTIHTPNPGSMLSCLEPGWPCRYSMSKNPARKLAGTLEMAFNGRCWIGLNPLLANDLVAELLLAGGLMHTQSGSAAKKTSKAQLCSVYNFEKDLGASLLDLLPELTAYAAFQREIQVEDGSRLDFRLHGEQQANLYLEVKSVSLKQGAYYEFPDAKSLRARKHLGVLEALTSQADQSTAFKNRAAILFIIQRSDARKFRPARTIDPEYARALRSAAENGVEVYALQASVRPTSIRLKRRIEVELS